jgi:hypothetical protein
LSLEIQATVPTTDHGKTHQKIISTTTDHQEILPKTLLQQNGSCSPNLNISKFENSIINIYGVANTFNHFDTMVTADPIPNMNISESQDSIVTIHGLAHSA